MSLRTNIKRTSRLSSRLLGQQGKQEGRAIARPSCSVRNPSVEPEFLSIHDYQWGDVAILVAAESDEDVERALGKSWEILAGATAENHPMWEYCERKGNLYDLDVPTGLLAKLLTNKRITKGGIILPGQGCE